MIELSQSIIERVRQVTETEESDDSLVLHEPLFSGNEWDYVKDCLDTGWVSSVGQYVSRFEAMLCEFTGAPYAVATVNGTAALHIALLLAGVEPGVEVLLPTLTFVATANAVAYCGAVPHFVDSDESTLGVSPQKLEAYLRDIAVQREGVTRNKRTGRKIQVLVPMHTFGHAVDLDELSEICLRYGIMIVEDAAESLGTLYKGRHTGSTGPLAAVSFNGNKVVTTGGGGALLINDEALAKQAKHLTTTAKVAHPWEIKHDTVGYNYRMPNINAALGCAQLEQLPLFIRRKRELAEAYRLGFAGVSGVTFFVEPDFSESNYWLNTLLLNEASREIRDQVLKDTNDHGIMTRPVWELMHRLPMFEGCPRMGDLTVAEQLSDRIINIPSSVRLGRG